MEISPKTYEPVACVLCGQSETRLIASKGQFGWATYVSICKSCGLVFLNPRWTKDGYNYFYASEYDQYYRFDEDKATEKEQRKAQVVWDRLGQYTPAQFRTALDIGCGLGWCLHTIQQASPGTAIAGIEPSVTCSEHFINEIGGELVARDVDSDWHLANQERFDLIIFRHVLEHLLDPVAVLEKVAQTLSAQGVLYIAVPDMMHPDGSLSDFWYRCVHTYYYSKPTLRRIAARAGLQPVAIQEESSELWAIFRKGQAVGESEPVSVYEPQMAALNQYKRKRFLRSGLLVFSPKKLSQRVPKSVKNLVPKSLRARFRNLVYRH
jgi:SAM-dependent methyltransferase